MTDRRHLPANSIALDTSVAQPCQLLFEIVRHFFPAVSG
jgi:hypothetical protein